MFILLIFVLLTCVQLYSSCLRVLCGQMEGKKDDICRVLTKAYTSRCGTRYVTFTNYPRWDPDRKKLVDIYRLAGCTEVTVTTPSPSSPYSAFYYY